MNKRHLRKRSLNDRERHLSLGMSSSETAHAGRGGDGEHLQNNIKAKHEQLKLSKTDCKHLGPGRYVSVINDNH
jgi:hypothetical protein